MNYKAEWDRMTVSEWLLHHQRNVHFKYKYRGLDMQKNPMDMMIYMELIHNLKPEVIIEIGGAGGGTALWLAHQLEIAWMGLKYGKVISLDINHGGFKAEHSRIVKITSDSTQKETAERVYKEVGAWKKVLIIHDGSHKKCDIKKDFEHYGKLVNVGSYFIVEDGIMDVYGWKDHRTDGHDCGMIAGQEIVKENEGWEIDMECEKYVMTYNPSGYLKRVK